METHTEKIALAAEFLARVGIARRELARGLHQMHGPVDVPLVRRVLLVEPNDARPRVVVLGPFGHVGEGAQFKVVVALAFFAA